MDRGFFSSAQLDICVSPASARDSHDARQSRKQVYYDEELAFWLHVHLPKLELSQEQAQRVFRSPALKLVAEIAYLDPASTKQAQGRGRDGSRSFGPHPLLTPAAEPQASTEDAQYANLKASQVLWSAQWEATTPEAFQLWHTDAGWTAAFRWDHVRIGFPKVATNLLAVDVTLTFQEALDPSLPDLLQSPPTPPTPPSKPKRLSSGPAFPSSEYARRLSQEVDLGSEPFSAPTDHDADAMAQESKRKAARLRRHKMLEEEYAFEGLEEVNLLEDLSLDDKATDLYLPASRFPASLASASLAVAASSSSQSSNWPSGHARSRSQAHQRRLSQADDTNPAAQPPAEELPALRRVHRRVLNVCSAVNIRMRTVPVTVASPDAHLYSTEPSAPGLTLSVEVHNPASTGFGFELHSVTVELDPVHTAKDGTIKSSKEPLFAPIFPIVLDRFGQYNFLFSLQAGDVLLDQSEARAIDPQARELPPPTPISALLSPKQTLSRRHQINMAQTPTVEDGKPTQPQQRSPLQHQGPAEEHRKSACIVVRGRPIIRTDPYQQQKEVADLYSTDIIESRWHSALDLRPFIKAREQQFRARARASSLSSDSTRRTKTASVNNYVPERRDTVTSLTSAFSDVAFDTPTLSDRRISDAYSASTHAHRSSLPVTAQSASSQLMHSPVNAQSGLTRPSSGTSDAGVSSTAGKDWPSVPTPAYPSYDGPRPEAAIIPPLDNPRQPLLSQSGDASLATFLPRGIPDSEAGSGVLVHVSLLPLHTKPAEAEPPSTFNPNTPVIPQAATMRPSLSSVSFKSNVSSRADAIAEDEETAASVTDEERKRSHVQLFDIFLLEVFVMNKTSNVKMFSVGVPSRTARDESAAASVRLGLGLQDAGLAAIAEGQPEVGVVALEDNVLVGPLQPGTCQSVRIRFLALRPGVHAIGELEITDTATGHRTRLKNVLSLVVDV